MDSIIIAPSILAADFGRLAEQIQEAEKAGADWIHIDVMDGHFVPNLTMGPLVVEACRRATDLFLDVHLMIERPENLIDAFAKAGADSITVHVETCPHLHRTIQQIRAAGCKTGVAINPSTPVNWIEPVLGMVDLVLVMSVNPGFGGQTFISESLDRVRTIREMVDAAELKTIIQMDGGVSVKTIRACHDAGARSFVAGSAVYGHAEGVAAAVQQLRSEALT